MNDKNIVRFIAISMIGFLKNTNSVIVETKYGIILGRQNQAPNGKDVKEFLAIPYAKPPVAELRFKPPLELEKWSGTINATELGNCCMQKTPSIIKLFPNFNQYESVTPMSEDCLHLNVWVPDCYNCTNLAVMVFIHGGAYYLGANSAPAYDGGVLATEEKVIVVVPNYRLGPFGFFSLDNKEVIGNAGLLDQQMAFKWVHENIKNFEGDPNRIVIYGQSAGGSSVNLHLVAPSSWDYFHEKDNYELKLDGLRTATDSQGLSLGNSSNVLIFVKVKNHRPNNTNFMNSNQICLPFRKITGAIVQSGFINNQWSLNPKTKNDEIGLDLASNLKCHKETVTDTLRCLQEQEAQAILNVKPKNGFFMPVVDGILLTEHPFKSYSSAKIKPCNIMAGVLKNEASVFLFVAIPDYILPLDDDLQPPYESIIDLINKIPAVKKYPLLNRMVEYVYTNLRDTGDYRKTLDTLSYIMSDTLFTCHMKKLLDRYVSMANSTKKTYSYLLSYKASFVKTDPWIGVTHGADLLFTFGHPLNKLRNDYHKGNVSSDDVELSKRIMRYWANFARNGNPSESATGRKEEIEWPEYTATNEEYLILRPNSTMVGLNYRNKYCKLYNELIPSIIKDLENFVDTH